MTVQGVPEGVQPPVVTALSSSLLQITWSEPKHPSGIIQRYHLNQTGAGTIFTHHGGPKSYTVTGKSPSLSQLSVILTRLTFPSLLMQLFPYLEETKSSPQIQAHSFELMYLCI